MMMIMMMMMMMTRLMIDSIDWIHVHLILTASNAFVVAAFNYISLPSFALACLSSFWGIFVQIESSATSTNTRIIIQCIAVQE